jgi:hypothetical protein
MEASQWAAVHALLVEIPTTVVVANSPDPSVMDDGLQADLDTIAQAHAKSLDPNVARILPEAVVATWEVHRVQEILLSTVALVPGYCEKPVTQKRSSHACLIIEILSRIQNI